MTYLLELDSKFYKDALNLFVEAGHAATDLPIFCNHSVEEAVYFDCEASIVFSKKQLSILACSANISHLFDLNTDLFSKGKRDKISFYSLELLSLESCRSQAAYDVHKNLHSTFNATASVLLFKNKDKVMLSFVGYDSDVMLSDWYSIEKDFEHLINKIDISNMTLASARAYFYDFVYCSARWYYLNPISEEYATYSVLPTNYFLADERIFESAHVDREEIKEMVQAFLRFAETEYGDDYIDSSLERVSLINLGAELDLLAYEIEMEEDASDFHEVLLYEDVENEYIGDLYGDTDVESLDRYEFEDIKPEIFENPMLLIKWLEKNER